MKFLNLNKKCQLVLMTSSEIASWISDESPLPGDAVLNEETGVLNYFDEESGEVKYTNTPVSAFKIDTIMDGGESVYINDTLIGKKCLIVMRNGVGKRVIDGSPANINEIDFSDETGTLTLYAGDSFGVNEWLSIIYGPNYLISDPL